MRVLLPFGVNNPASLVIISVDDPYDTKSEYTKKGVILHLSEKTDHCDMFHERHWRPRVYISQSFD